METVEPAAAPKDGGMRTASRLSLVVVCAYAVYFTATVSRDSESLHAVFRNLDNRLPPLADMVISPGFTHFLFVVIMVAVLKEWTIRSARVALWLNGGLVVLVEFLRQTYLLGTSIPFIDLLLDKR